VTRVVLAIDQGTSNTKVLLVTEEGRVIARASRPLPLTHPQPGWVETSPEALWDSVADAIADAVGQAPASDIAAVGISNQRETVVLWDRESGQAVAPAIVWQCRRTSDRCAELAAGGHAEQIVARTGLGIDPLFPAAKIAWLLDNVAGARARAERGELACGTVDSWLLWRLTGGSVHATDHGNASRTQLLAIDTGQWDGEMLALFGVPRALLPEIRSSNSNFGSTCAGLAGIGEGIPIQAMLGDSHAAMAGHGFRGPGEAKVTCGTGSSVMVLTPNRVHSSHGLSSTIAWSRHGVVQHALEGNIAVSGHAAAYAVKLLNLTDEDELTALARSVPDCDGVTFVPALAGIGAPHWIDRARGQIAGLSLGSTSAHVARAVFEGIAHQIHDVFDAMQADLDARLPSLSVDGGASRNDFLMQMLANLVDCPIRRPPMTDASAFGAARFAWEALGAEPATGDGWPADQFEPALMPRDRERLVERWRRAISQAALVSPLG